MENLNAEQVKNALKCCSLLYEDRDCTVCPKSTSKVCTVEVMRESLFLITSQEQRIRELTEERKDFEIRALRAENEATKYKDRYETAKQSHEMLSESYDHLEKTKDELLSERARLTDENGRLRADTLENIKIEFAMRFGTYTDKDQVKIADVFMLLDQIAKEMLEGEKLGKFCLRRKGEIITNG